MKHCECCTQKAQLYEKLTTDIILFREWFQDIHSHSQKLGSKKTKDNKMCIDIIIDKGVDLVTAIVNNGKYKKYLSFCTKDGEA